DVEAVRIVVDEITAHIVGTGVAYDYTQNTDLTKVELCADVETFDVSYSLTYGDILSTKVYKQTGTNTAVLLTAGANNDYTIVGGIITINTESLSDLDKVYVVLETVCGDITSNSFVYDELPLPATAVITDNNEDTEGEVCYDATVVFTADATANTGFSYNWSYKLATDNGWTMIEENDDNFVLGTDGVTLTVDGISDDYVVRAYKVNKETDCVSAEAGESEIIKVLDRIAITTITPSEGGATPKRGNTYTYTVSGLTNNDYFEDYTWEYSGTGVTLTNASTETLTIEFSKIATPGTLSVVANASKCGSSLPVETDLEITIDATKNMVFSAVGKNQMTVAWTSGTGDGKILLGTQSTSGVNTLNKTINNTVSSELVDLLDGISTSAVWGTAGSTINSTVLGTTSVPYKYLLNDINNTQTSVIITGLTSNRRYNFRLIDFINYTSGRVYQPNTNTNSRVTQSKEGEENYGNTENFISLISPNPAKDNISFSMNLVNEQPVTIEIFTIEGRQVITFKNNEFMSAGNHFLNIPLGDLAAGTYSIVIRMGDEFILDSFVVMP
ncbi:MAG: T9SS type A sorting domain-containing protein, partial [Candidatus Kapaibacteriota bacterium]